MYKEIHSLDGVSYELSAIARGGDYVAVWQCQKCSFAGTLSKRFPNEDDALLAAQSYLVSEHHARVHFARNVCGKTPAY